MNKQIEVFFDYTCPYCNRGIRQFINLLPDYPEIEVVWRPCEAHPRPEYSPIHSDVAIQAMFSLKDQEGDLPEFHVKVYDAWFKDRKRIDDFELLSSLAEKCGGSKLVTMTDLKEEKYKSEVQKSNIYAWGEKNLFAVPSYICNGKSVLSKDGLLASIEEVRKLLE